MQKKMYALLVASCFAASAVNAQQADGNKRVKAYMVADAHLDTQWNWDIQTTIKSYVWKTLTQNLYLLKTYPNYVFNFEGAVKYSWMKEYYPNEFEQMKQYVANGRWHLTGSGWDANETVIVSPESWLRNILIGQTFYRQEFGKESTDVFLPDCFGFGYDLPTLAAHCGLIGFSSQKLGWRKNPFYEGNKKYPYTIGLWQGIDGSRIMMTHGFSYGQRFKDEDLSANEKIQKEITESPLGMVYRYYGTGDTGGSPTIPSVRALEKGIKGNGPVEIISSTSDRLYKEFMPFDKHPELPVFDGELLMDVHGTGCYTSQAAMKLYNRQNEHLGDAAERASVAAQWLGTATYPHDILDDTWKRVLVHQFHDDLPGTSIPRAYEFSWNDELISLQRFSNVLTTAVGSIAAKMNTNVSGTPVVLYNTESFPVSDVVTVTLPQTAAAYTVTDANGKKLASQVVADSKGNRHLLVAAKVPATGLSVISVKAGGKAVAMAEKDANTMENSVYKLSVDKAGNISSIVDKRNGKQLVAAGKSVGLVVFDDCKSEAWPAWEILKPTLDKEPVNVDANVSVKLIEDGALRKTLRVTKTYGDSKFAQYIRLYEGGLADRIDVYNEVDWHSLNSLLKVNFPLNVSNEKATYDLGLGSVERGNNQANSYEVYSHEWTDLTDRSGDYGVTVLNDCKYGWDKPNDNTLRLSLLYAPKPGRGYVYQDKQDMGYHEFTYSIVGHAGQLDKAQAVKKSTVLNSPLRAFATSKHKGELGREFSFVSIDNDNLTVRALKKAETSDEFVVRVYENTGKEAQNAVVTFAGDIESAVEADGTEKTKGEATFSGNKLNVSVTPFSVRTYKVRLKKHGQSEAQQEQVTLPMDKSCFTFNGFRTAANFEGGNSYAAELIPDEGITVDNVKFVFGEKDGLNGVVCKGNVIDLPAGNYNKVYLLAASSRGDRKATFKVGANAVNVDVPFYSGFVGQWGHTGHTMGYLKNAEVAYVGNHSHSSTADKPYEFAYMFKYGIDIPKGARQLVLPEDESIVVFAATVVNEGAQCVPAGSLFKTGNRVDELATKSAKKSILKNAKIVACSGEYSPKEAASNLIDGNLKTKWCDIKGAPYYVSFQLDGEHTISGWYLANAGEESSVYITSTCLLQYRNSEQEEWKTADMINGNKLNEVERTFTPVKARYVRLYVVSATQNADYNAVRIHEFEVY
ncbi:MAG: discoidin domain-containing protein [Prevotella sp.]|nr:discoidin domain-containing protein [Prevotella sp.]